MAVKKPVARGGQPKQAEQTERKPKGATGYPPYVNAYNSIPKLFDEIKKASIPSKFSLDFLESILGLTSSSHRALIPLLKKLGFIDQHNVPTDDYKNVRDSQTGKLVMADRVKHAYVDLYKANEFAHKLKKDEITGKLRTMLGVASDDPILGSVVGTFLELVKLSDFDTVEAPETEDERGDAPGTNGTGSQGSSMAAGDSTSKNNQRDTHARPFGLSYTINLNLPATADIEVFNAIFKSLKEHLLND